MPMFKQPLAIVDIETTGAKSQQGRIIEIGVIRIEEGKVVNTYSTLINPQMPIPFTISNLTGIQDKDVVNAPTFREIKQDLLSILEGCLFVAHNASFDYGFVKHEFQRLGVDFNANTLCSVKLSRKLFPEHTQHNLGVLIERFGLTIQTRHRALDDAKVVWDFLLQIAKNVEPTKITQAFHQLTHQPLLPSHLNIKSFQEIPEDAGVYTFYDKNQKPIYVGKAAHLREKIMGYFEDMPTEGKRAQMRDRLAHIQWQVCVGEIGSKLLQQHLIKVLKPTFNLFARVPKEQSTPLRWPFNGKIAIEEKHDFEDTSYVYVVDKWVLLKALIINGEDRTPFFNCDQQFDPVMAKILQAYIKNNHQRVKVIP